MDFGRLFRQAARLLWQHKSWWLPGALLGSGAILSAAARLWLPAVLPAEWLKPEAWLRILTGAELLNASDLPDLPQIGLNLTSLSVAVFLATLLIWLLVTVAEGTLITAVIHPAQPLQDSIRRGVRLLGRFIAIDALVFLPWFLLALAGMLWLLLATLGAAAVSLRGDGDTAVFLLVTGWLCWLPLACLLLPVGAISVIYRRLVFRDAALGGRGARAAVRHTWRIVRRHPGTIILLALLLWGVTLLPVTAVSALTWPLLLLESGSPAAALRLIVFLLIIGLNAILHAFMATVWTLAYAELPGNRTAAGNETRD